MTTRHHHQRRIQNCIGIWLDANIDEEEKNCRQTLRRLRRAVPWIKTFTDVDECFDTIERIEKQSAFLVVSGSLGQAIKQRIQDTVQLESVYVFCGDEEFHKTWASEISKIKGVHSDIDLICDQLKQDRLQCDQSAVKISFSGVDCLFMYTQIMKKTLMDVDDPVDYSLKKLIRYCKEIGDTDPKELEELRYDYSKKAPIFWYTAETFLYGMLNRSLWQMDVTIIQRLGFFIRDLHREIEKRYLDTNYKTDRERFILYRGQGISSESFENMKKSIGNLMSFNNFLSTSTSPEISLNTFARPASRKQDSVGILFKLVIDPEICRRSNIPYTSVKDVGALGDDEKEILFTTHTIFRIDSIDSIEDSETNRLHKVTITLVGNDDHDFQKLTNSITEEVERRTSPGWSRFGLVLLKLERSDDAKLIYTELLEHPHDQKQKGEYLHYLAFVHSNRGEYVRALEYYQDAVEIRQKVLRENHPDIADSYNNIGLVYCKMGDYKKALEYYERCLEMWKKSLPENHPDIATSYMNIGLVYWNMGDYKKALEYYERCLEMRKKSLPENHPDIASSYLGIGNVYYNMGDYKKALEYYERCLEMRKQSLPENHPDIASSLWGIGLVYKSMGDYKKALEFHERCLEMKKKSLPENHPDIASSYSNIGSVYYNMGDHQKSLEYYERSLKIRKKSLPKNHPDLALSYNNLGCCFESMGDNEKALKYFKIALGMYEKTLPENHPSSERTKRNIERVSEKVKK